MLRKATWSGKTYPWAAGSEIIGSGATPGWTIGATTGGWPIGGATIGGTIGGGPIGGACIGGWFKYGFGAEGGYWDGG